ncbi:polymerase (RNA) III (DNA directed) polypeptide G like b [Anabas testudineus]|uniref:DNA-directed RNA polymerase III subunit n=1 Tax=Anabas testudineus TaxID=64144 RepID=A0A3Q1J252_ANATE|nr:polymerase (RNA) III (DNA directed) polypeptide G like b [Anabas testudineus]
MSGRGRGRRTMTFNVDSVGISRGDSFPPSVQQPTPPFPVMEQKPLPLTGGEEAEYLLALKQEFRGAMKSLPCFIQPAAAHRDVERYSDKYHSSEQSEHLMDWTPDWKRFPKELRVHVRKPHRDGVSLSQSNRVQTSQKKKTVKEKEEVLLKLESLEKKEEQQSSGGEEEEGEEKKKQEEEEAEGEEEYDEEEFEEETDYIMSYFDNGEDFGGDSDDNMDEAIY